MKIQKSTINRVMIGKWMLFLLGLILFSCNNQPTEDMPRTLTINENWQFRQSDQDVWMPAKVPGTVHNDLIDNNIIEDPFWRTNEKNIQWIEDKDWIYKTSFDVPEEMFDYSRIDLKFHGLDTYAEVYLNDQLILETDNMFVGSTIECKELLKPTENELSIHFHSAVRVGMDKLNAAGYPIPSTNEQAPEGEKTSVFTRKAPFHYGWDWGPRFVTAGIWRDIELTAWSYNKIDNVYLQTKSVEKDVANISGKVNFQNLIAGNYILKVLADDKELLVKELNSMDEGNFETDIELSIENPELWWTNGLGEQPLYIIEFRLLKNDKMIDNHKMRFGIRTLELVQEPDSIGRSFKFVLNGVPVFMKGANIIPSETLTPSVTKETYEKMIQSAVDANMNMLRVWGGAIYEEDIFYDLCDENGILVWQDFMFACNLQPGNPEHLENIREEAEYNVIRLRNHPSIALWCGNNENLIGWHNWGWQDLYKTTEQRDFMWETYEKIFYEILRETVNTYDPKTKYWASSPSSYGDQYPDRKSGDEHDWTIWFGQKPFEAFNEDIPRFVSEWGLQAFPSIHTINAYTLLEDRTLFSEVLTDRQRSAMEWIEPGFNGNDMIRFYMALNYQVPGDFDHFTYVSQLSQALGYTTAIEAHRRAMPHCMGSLYWQLNDCWPTTSWSTVDYYYRWKASHYAVKDAFKPVILSPSFKGDSVEIFIISDLLKDKEANLNVELTDLDGKLIFTENVPVIVKSNTSSYVHTLDSQRWINEDNHTNMVLHLTLTNDDNEWVDEKNIYFAKIKDLELPDPGVTYELEKKGDQYHLNIQTEKLAKNIRIETPFPDVTFSDNYFDLLPGESREIIIKTEENLDPESDIQILHLQNTLK